MTGKRLWGRDIGKIRLTIRGQGKMSTAGKNGQK
jgi:hypothetical protein